MYNSKAYYEYALELSSQNQVIEEAIMTPMMASCVLPTTHKQVLSLEESSTNTVNEFINNILTEASNQIELIENRQPVYSKQLVSLCEQKIKSMTAQECNELVLKGVNKQECINRITDAVTNDCILVDADIVDFCKGNFNAEYKNKIKSCTERLDEATNIKMKATDVNFRDICNMIYEYRTFTVEDNCPIKCKEVMKESNIKVDFKNAKDIKDTVYEYTNYLVRAKDTLTELQLASFRNKENILKEFVSDFY